MAEIPVRVASNDEQRNDEPVRSRRQDQREQPSPTKQPRRRKRSTIVKLIIAIVLIGGVIVGGWVLDRATNASAQIDSNKYQALFLSNGQVYFGKLKVLSGNYYSLSDIFYLQTNSTSSSDTDSKNPQSAANANSSDVNLIKLGSEVHGPEDQMVVNRDQVLFFENLKSDGRVSASINQYLKK